jgi:hypothetical protein
MQECPNCEAEIEPDHFPFGDDVRCPSCGIVWETDWECDWDNRFWWIESEKEVAMAIEVIKGTKPGTVLLKGVKQKLTLKEAEKLANDLLEFLGAENGEKEEAPAPVPPEVENEEKEEATREVEADDEMGVTD